MQNEALDFLKTILNWRKNSKAISEGELLHYAPDYQSECYVYARKTDKETVLVILNGSDKEQALPTSRYHEVIGNYTSGKDIITGQIINLEKDLTISPKNVYILELN